MRILVITALYEPDCVGIAAVASDMCAALAERGHDVSVYTTYPYYPEWKRKSKVNPLRIQQEVIGGVKVRRHGVYIPSNPSRLLPRVVHELSFPFSLMRSLRDRHRFDLVMAYCPLLGSVAFAALRKLIYREPLWVSIQDIPAEASRASGISRSKFFQFVGTRLQRRLFNAAEFWSTISPEMVTQLSPTRPAGTTLQLCPNWLTRSLGEHLDQLSSKVGRTPSDPLRLLYCGTIGKKQDLLHLCQRLGDVDLNFRFQIHGEGAEANAVRSWVERRGDVRFEFTGLLAESKFVETIHEADWFLISEKAGAGFSFLPSKLIPAISVGTPVLAVSDRAGPLGREVTANKVGIVTEWSQLDQLPGQLDVFRRAPAEFKLLQENCLKRAVAFRRKTAIDRLEQMLLAAISQHPEREQRILRPHARQGTGRSTSVASRLDVE